MRILTLAKIQSKCQILQFNTDFKVSMKFFQCLILWPVALDTQSFVSYKMAVINVTAKSSNWALTLKLVQSFQFSLSPCSTLGYRRQCVKHRLHNLSSAKYYNSCKDILVLRVIINVLPKVLISYVIIWQNVIKYVRSIGTTALVNISMGASQISIMFSEHFPLCLYLYPIFNFLSFHTK